MKALIVVGYVLVWNKFQFYNATGFHVYFNDDAMEKIVHIQAWTLGIGETVCNFPVSQTTDPADCGLST